MSVGDQINPHSINRSLTELIMCFDLLSTQPNHHHDNNNKTTHDSDAGIDIAAVSWWGQASRAAAADSQGVSTDGLIPTVLAAAEAVAADPVDPRPIKIAFHLEPYPGRTAASVREDLAYIHARYGASPAFVPICECAGSREGWGVEWGGVG
jgi:hypothetical protein